MAGETAFAYHEPAITTILNQTGFLLVLNRVNVCLDKLVYCGLIGQSFIGILWGTPGTTGAKWLVRDMATVSQQLGYLGLIMLVYEGGLSTSLPSLKANLLLSLAVAITGIGAPMVLSFILTKLVSATPPQAFSAGAALSATSLGTTFTILSTTVLIKTRLGTVATGAAMLDDVVGLVVSFGAVTVRRPVPVVHIILFHRARFPDFTGTVQFYFLAYTCLLVGMVSGATYAGTASLFAAYLVGVMTSWIDDFSKEYSSAEGPDNAVTESSTKNHNQHNQSTAQQTVTAPSAQHKEPPTGRLVYEKYYHEPVTRILTPLFFASVGFAIPITEMFTGKIVWRGIVYAILMTFGQLITGLWLFRFSSRLRISSILRVLKELFSRITTPHNHPPTSSLPPQPKSLYPASILGLAMVSRGEVGYLIASLAESKGIFGTSSGGHSSETYLVVVWAISLCTLLGPICVGTLVKRVKALQRERCECGDMLGPVVSSIISE
ncbi:Sodium/hydrogen exchanger family-domain-containing protein [Aspergillus alliaceus]|uniref:Sodium/hydrogen exchanger family-domain-containing protein n=1 Tax=Petromyces alliaceus TaxID=209559 RepID=A0A5N7BYX1_PETAA|nr:Sodium/hydrogen exchanger family-domain-containing protein [Aspergillus alliaceus]